jgi:hypothetical protein
LRGYLITRREFVGFESFKKHVRGATDGADEAALALVEPRFPNRFPETSWAQHELDNLVVTSICIHSTPPVGAVPGVDVGFEKRFSPIGIV